MMITLFYLIICHSCRCCQPSIYVLPTKYENIINTTTNRLLQNFSPPLLWILQITGQWHENIPYRMPLLLHYSWTEDLNPVTIGIATECVYTIFFYTSTSQTLCQQSDETLFGCFVIALNAAFTQLLSLADEGYESGSDTIDLPTPLWKAPHIHHVSSMEHASFSPVTTTPHSTPQTPPRRVHWCLSFSSADNFTPDSTPVCSDSSDEEEDFQTVALDHEHWTSKETPERTFCIHENGLPHNLCQ